jgi:hypothetical protein
VDISTVLCLAFTIKESDPDLVMRRRDISLRYEDWKSKQVYNKSRLICDINMHKYVNCIDGETVRCWLSHLWFFWVNLSYVGSRSIPSYTLRYYNDMCLVWMGNTYNVFFLSIPPLSEIQLLYLMDELIVAGVETTTSTLSWAMLFLVLNTDVQDKVGHAFINNTAFPHKTTRFLYHGLIIGDFFPDHKTMIL